VANNGGLATTRDVDAIVRRRAASLSRSNITVVSSRAVPLDADQLACSRAASLSRAAQRSGRFGAGDGGAQAATLTAAQEVHLSRALRRGQAAESVRRELGAAASDAEWAFSCGLPSSAALRAVLSQAQTARSLLLARNIGLVKTVARRLTNSLGASMRVDDLITDGLLGLCGAIEQYDPERGYRFSTFAFARVEAAQRRAIQNGRSTLRVPVWVQEVNTKLLKARAAFAADGMLQPSDEQLAGAAHTPLAHVQAAAAAFSRREASFDAMSLQEPDSASALFCKEDLQPWSEASPDAELQADPFWASTSAAQLDRLPDVQREALRAIYGLDGGVPQTPRALAVRLGMTQKAVNRLVQNGLTVLSAAA
jgi:RNA polymerase nonessential primary-like sigma factor